MNKKRGFTLIELLAVIVILAVIALIASPMVLKYINSAKEGAALASAEGILRAADNYYISASEDEETEFPMTFYLNNKKDASKLKIKGKEPDFGVVVITEDGDIYIEANYDNETYVKAFDDENLTDEPKVIGKSVEWETDGKGTIKNYMNFKSAFVQVQLYGELIDLCIDYATRNTSAGFDFTKSLKQNIAAFEAELGLTVNGIFPEEARNELNILFDIYNTPTQLTSEDEVIAIALNNADRIPHAIDFYTKVSEDSDKIIETTIYNYLLENENVEYTVVIPNYVEHPDGTLEKITTINGGINIINGYAYGKAEKTLIISHGIKTIGNHAFYIQGFSNVVIPSSVETIGEASFGMNMLSTIYLPPSLKTIGKEAFKHNQLIGEIVIPKNVTSIGYSAFDANGWTLDDGTCNALVIYNSDLCKVRNINNAIKKLTFEQNSQINNIDNYAFKGNLLTTVTIPGSIKKIGYEAFNCPNLTTATIERAKGSDLSVDNYAFRNSSGAITPQYQ